MKITTEIPRIKELSPETERGHLGFPHAPERSRLTAEPVATAAKSVAQFSKWPMSGDRPKDLKPAS